MGSIERDSRKDEAVVFIFIFATAGLLGWAALKPWVGKWVEVSNLRSHTHRDEQGNWLTCEAEYQGEEE